MKENCIVIPESMKGQIESEGTLEVGYKLVEDEGGQYLQVTSVEGETIEAAQTPLDKMAGKMGMNKFGAKPAVNPIEE